MGIELPKQHCIFVNNTVKPYKNTYLKGQDHDYIFQNRFLAGI